MTNTLQFASRYTPEGATEQGHPGGLGVVYLYITRNDKLAAVAYAGKQSKAAWHFVFPTEERRTAKIQEFWQDLEGRRQRMAERRTERSRPHSLKVGDVVYNSWGYDQTNVDWYQVTRTSANYVWLREINSTCDETGFMCGQSKPLPGEFSERNKEETKHAVQMYETGASIHFRHGCGSVWTPGTSHYASWYA